MVDQTREIEHSKSCSEELATLDLDQLRRARSGWLRGTGQLAAAIMALSIGASSQNIHLQGTVD